MIQPAGLCGNPRSGQVRSACSKASWTASSAKSKLPVTRIRAATARPASWRNRWSTSLRVSAVGSALRLVRELLDWSQLDRAKHCAGAAASRFDSLVCVGDVEDVVAAELLLGFGERPVSDDGFAIGRPDRCRRGCRLQRLAGQIPALLFEPVAVLVPDLCLGGLLIRWGVRSVRFHRCLVAVDQQQVLHAPSLCSGRSLRPLTLMTNT